MSLLQISLSASIMILAIVGIRVLVRLLVPFSWPVSPLVQSAGVVDVCAC